MSFTEYVPLLIGISVASVSGAYLSYLLLKKEEDENKECTAYNMSEMQMKVPQSCLYFNSETEKVLEEIQRKTGTKLSLKEGTCGSNICTLEGGVRDGELAKSLIYIIIANNFAHLYEEKERLKECNETTEKVTSHADTVSKSDASHLENKHVAKDSTDTLRWSQHTVSLPINQPVLIQVFVSSVIDPDCFWVQLIDLQATDLDHLEKEINTYYSKEENCQLHALGNVSVNDLVAAPFNDDGSLYRARVTEIIQSEEGMDLELFYVDYGDDERIEKERVFSLKPEFLRMKFQAVQCSLGNVKPSGGSWSEEAIDYFCSVTNVAKWKILKAEVVDMGLKGEPVLKLFETKNGRDVNIADELVKQKYAFYSDKLVCSCEGCKHAYYSEFQ